ncbi:hypothetical protein [Microbacterium alcoholitolerans]|uniref:hypothetical protein n=1 Tax=unclassified Microbacterium TaxID=2609290 RepID=UPI003D187287
MTDPLTGPSRDMLLAIIAESERNQRENEYARTEQTYTPKAWTPEEEAALMDKLHGTDAERLDRLIAEHNEQQRRR